MLVGKNSIQETYYDILHVKEDASYKEIRVSYRSAILNFHPDKLVKTNEMVNPSEESGDRFLKVQKAWEILSNSMSRALYDNELQGSRAEIGVAEDVGIYDMMVEDNGDTLVLCYQCQCAVLARKRMGSGEGRPHWSVYDGVKVIPSTPEALMAAMNTAIANLEYSRATALLESKSSSQSKIKRSDVSVGRVAAQYDARLADEAYKAGCAALAAGKLDEALQSLNVSLSKCPPNKTSAVAKLQSLISLTSQQLQKSSK
ncbi:uncharacterized protein LOC119984695 isoform X2 [Tripterygium wilfordii]|uniref:uncharacterized protein LOC119984695 isoform X2 n=1 Tax=Tripterygium wilfordii TaxID=458696 RepID=UPI0018F83E02|nr:uncharacterized protein LOC119984695 isoform X2 [Tripterygium wilfordii]